MDVDNYFIKNGYQNNPPNTAKANPREYWTDNRIVKSQQYQYHVYQYASQVFKKNKFKSLLDIGSGPGTKVKMLFDLKAIDLCMIDQVGMESIVNKVCPQAKFYASNLEVDTLSMGKCFDMIVCSDVLEHLENPTYLLKNIHSSLKKGGICVLSTPDRIMRRGALNLRSPNLTHVREWSFQELRNYIGSMGFKILEHKNLPLKKINPIVFWISQTFLNKMVLKSEWFGTQMVLVKKAD